MISEVFFITKRGVRIRQSEIEAFELVDDKCCIIYMKSRMKHYCDEDDFNRLNSKYSLKTVVVSK